MKEFEEFERLKFESDAEIIRLRAEIDRLQHELNERTAAANVRMCDLLGEIERLLAALKFLVEEITDLEGREGMTDYDFAEQVIALAQSQRAIIAKAEG